MLNGLVINRSTEGTGGKDIAVNGKDFYNGYDFCTAFISNLFCHYFPDVTYHEVSAFLVKLLGQVVSNMTYPLNSNC